MYINLTVDEGECRYVAGGTRASVLMMNRKPQNHTPTSSICYFFHQQWDLLLLLLLLILKAIINKVMLDVTSMISKLNSIA